MNKKLFILCLTYLVLILTSCQESIITSNRDIVFPDSTVSYIKHVQPFIAVTCAYQGCHSDDPQQAKFSMTTHSALIFAMAGGLVRPKNPDGSLLVQKLEGTSPHPYYFRWKDKVTQNQKKGIRKWIEEGAKDN